MNKNIFRPSLVSYLASLIVIKVALALTQPGTWGLMTPGYIDWKIAIKT